MAKESTGGGGKTVLLHPLAIVAISDHFTCIQAGASPKPTGSKVIGLLWGKQQGLDVVITDAVELMYSDKTSEGGEPVAFTREEVDKQKELYTKVYPLCEMLGWYSVGVEVQEADMAVHREMLKYNESPFFLLINPNPDPDAKDLPVQLYESETHYEEEVARMIFVACEFELETSQAERVTMEEVAKAGPTEGVSTLDLHVTSLESSLRSLAMRADQLIVYLKAVEDKRVPSDQRLLRAAQGVCNQLPAMHKGELEAAFVEDYADTLMVSYLATVTKATHAVGDLTEKFQSMAPARAHRSF
mmetsp:Transcript_35672/g.65267  ORF Transcript_35672/g.65267 Transcript_35672/m.65267 type:complete len:301 (+) Transcript_35672:24-926(+)